MIDFNGNELLVGDTVIFIRKGYRDYSIGVITGFTAKFVKIEQAENRHVDLNWAPGKQSPEQLIKIEFNDHHKKNWCINEENDNRKYSQAMEVWSK